MVSPAGRVIALFLYSGWAMEWRVWLGAGTGLTEIQGMADGWIDCLYLISLCLPKYSQVWLNGLVGCALLFLAGAKGNLGLASSSHATVLMDRSDGAE